MLTHHHSDQIETIRVKIFYLDNHQKKTCNEIFKKPSSKLEEIMGCLFIGEISTVDFEKLKSEHYVVTKIAKIPTTKALPFKLPTISKNYELVIPHLRSNAIEDLKELGIKIIEKNNNGPIHIDGIECDRFWVFLSPEQVIKAKDLDFVHSILPKNKLYVREDILSCLNDPKPRVDFRFFKPAIKKEELENFVHLWNLKNNTSITYYKKEKKEHGPTNHSESKQSHYKSSLGTFKIFPKDASDIAFVDELANQEGIVEISPKPEYMLLHNKR